jgi:hypothetical protein
MIAFCIFELRISSEEIILFELVSIFNEIYGFLSMLALVNLGSLKEPSIFLGRLAAIVGDVGVADSLMESL